MLASGGGDVQQQSLKALCLPQIESFTKSTQKKHLLISLELQLNWTLAEVLDASATTVRGDDDNEGRGCNLHEQQPRQSFLTLSLINSHRHIFHQINSGFSWKNIYPTDNGSVSLLHALLSGFYRVELSQLHRKDCLNKPTGKWKG